jgi:hypothetical protein
LAQLFARAVKQFFDWTDNWRLELQKIEAITIAAYIEQPAPWFGSRPGMPCADRDMSFGAARPQFYQPKKRASSRTQIESNTLAGSGFDWNMVYSFARVGAANWEFARYQSQ